MPTILPTWSFPLEKPPTLINAGSNAPHGLVPEEHYTHRRIWVLNLHQGRGILRIDGRDHRFEPGWITLVPPGLPHVYRFAARCRLSFLHFVPGSAQAATGIPLPVAANLGYRFEHWHALAAQASSRLPVDHPRNLSLLWDLLWQLHELAGEDHSGIHRHPVLRRALVEIGNSLSQPVYTAVLARRLGISKTHLNRLFRHHMGRPIHAHVVFQRCQVARRLLEETSLTIKEIAVRVGIPDPHLFNKTFRRLLGRAPSAFRKGRVKAAGRRRPSAKGPAPSH